MYANIFFNIVKELLNNNREPLTMLRAKGLLIANRDLFLIFQIPKLFKDLIEQDHLWMNVAQDQTIILSLQISLDHRSLSSIDHEIILCH